MKADTVAESLHAYMNRAGLTACEVGVFSRKISQLSKIRSPHLLERLWYHHSTKIY